MLFGNKSNDTLSSKLDHLTDNLKNPYIDLYHWIKGEIYDIQAITMAIKEKDANHKASKGLEKKHVNTNKDCENVQAGRKSMRTVMKSTNDTWGMVNKIESVGREIENMDKLCDIQLIMLGEQIIPQFKAGKQ